MTSQAALAMVSALIKKFKTLKEAVEYLANPDSCVDYLNAQRMASGKPQRCCLSEDEAQFQCKSVHAKRQCSIKVGTDL